MEIEKTEVYNYEALLKQPYWELKEALIFMLGITSFPSYLAKQDQEIVGKDYIFENSCFTLSCLGRIKSKEAKRYQAIYNSFFKEVDFKWKFDSHEYDLLGLRLRHPSIVFPYKGEEKISYFITPLHAIYWGLTNLPSFPQKMQKAIGINQCNEKKSLTVAFKRKLKVQAVGQILWSMVQIGRASCRERVCSVV